MFKFISPKFYHIWLVLFLMWLLSLLPFIIQRLLAVICGIVLYCFLHKRRRVAYVNISACFPEKTKRQKKQLLFKHFLALGMSVIAIANSFYLSKRRSDNICKIKGEQYLKNALAKKQAIMLLTGHWTAMMFAGCVVSKCGTMVDIFRPQNNHLFDSAMRKNFQKKGIKLVAFKDIKGILSALKSGLPTWYAHDQDLGVKKSIFAPFFGIDTATIAATSKLAKTTKACVLPVAFYYEDKKFIFEFYPTIKNYPTNNPQQDVSTTNKILESQIKQHPEQYLWTHKRFKTRPAGKKPFYK